MPRLGGELGHLEPGQQLAVDGQQLLRQGGFDLGERPRHGALVAPRHSAGRGG